MNNGPNRAEPRRIVVKVYGLQQLRIEIFHLYQLKSMYEQQESAPSPNDVETNLPFPLPLHHAFLL